MERRGKKETDRQPISYMVYHNSGIVSILNVPKHQHLFVIFVGVNV